MRVVAQVELLDGDPREALLALAQEVERRRRDVGLDRHVRVRRLGDALDHALRGWCCGRIADHAPQAAVQAARTPVADAGTGGIATGAARREARVSRRRSRRSARLGVRRPSSLSSRSSARSCVPAPAGGACSDGCARPAVGVGQLEHGLGQLARHDLHDGRDARLDQRAPVAVHDVAARRLDAHLAHAVLARLADVLLAGEHLQEPQAEEHDAEQHEREPAQQRHAQRELRRDRRAALFEAGRHQALDSGLRARRSCTRGGAGGAGRRAGTAAARGGTARRRAARAAC